ncbi:3-bisphosphoglycerate-dependent phosphoglycerate mutase [Seminavis robusta]|uniref:phosphoglycerate mutase (2,3-diphosphoglycerate-dependent) n=1 Tax=Seminavis robusta TaxID=568900 RepID=A0A9N8H260_9STRA|nr:3-bisphosphoglycerate-dependent phosphoglycerate mutase [Seminavis robusta]|eukprot:Sro13_g009950.1 3-bisphosphoglycerate-dependent phosphoglycerate mutase (832) ;mRNA; f:70059-72673
MTELKVTMRTHRCWSRKVVTVALIMMGSHHCHFSMAFTSTSSSSSTTKSHWGRAVPFAATKSRIDQEHDDDYSRGLSPRQERAQIQKEHIPLYDEGSKWPRRCWNLLTKPFRRHHQKPGTLILIKSGESKWKKRGIFTGWTNSNNQVTLTPQGEQECRHASRLLLEAGYSCDQVHCSMLNRAIQSVWIINKETGSIFLPVYKSWRLNERMYGSLQGISKKAAGLKFGQDVVQSWRRSFKARPPPMSKSDPDHPIHDRRYANIDPDLIPSSESLQDCMKRQKPLWDYRIAPALKAGSNVMVLAHSNSLRGLAKIIDGIDDTVIEDIAFPPGIPVVYKFQFDDNNYNKLKPLVPPEGSLVQEHTTGVFLEKPGLLKEALLRQTQWQTSVPGAADIELAPTVKRMNNMEESLLLLKKEQELEHWAATHPNHQTDFLHNVPSPFHHSPQESNPNRGILEAIHRTIQRVQPTEENTSEAYIINGDNDQGEFEEPMHTNTNNNNINAADGNSMTGPRVVPNMAYGIDIAPEDPVVVFVRHGTTPHNELGLFTGWEDPPLSDQGVDDAKRAGQLLKQHGFEFDVVYSSWLQRAIDTAFYIQTELDMQWLPLVKSWRLNERHYGKLTGQSKKMVANTYGQDQLKIWRRSFDVPPPKASSYSFSYPGNDYRRIKYAKDIRISLTETFCRSIEARRFELHRKWPKAESLKTCMKRSIPFYTRRIVPEAVKKGKRVLVTSHENAIRGILMHLCEIPPEHMNDLHLPNGLPLIYNVRRKCISLLHDGTEKDPMEVYDFGSAAQYLFRPCEITDEDFARMEEHASAVVESMDVLLQAKKTEALT